MAEPLARKQVEVRLVATADTKAATAAMAQLGRDAEKAGAAVRNLGAGGGAAGGGAAAAADAGSGGGAFGLGQLASPAAMIAAGAGFAAMAANAVRAIQSLGSEFLSTEEKVLGFARAIPVIGGALGNFIANISDAIDRLADEDTAMNVDRLRNTVPQDIARGQARSEFDMRAFGLRRGVRAAEFQAQAVGEFATLGSQFAPARLFMGGMPGAQGFGGNWFDNLDPRKQASLEAIQAAKRDLRAAELQAAASQKDADDARPGARAASAAARAADARVAAQEEAAMGTGGWNRRTAAFDRIREKSGGGVLGYYAAAGAFLAPSAVGMDEEGTRLRREEAQLKAQKAAATEARTLAELEAKITRNKEDQLNLLQRQRQLSAAIIADRRVDLQIVQEQAAKVRGGTQQFGMMDPSSREALLRSLQRFQEAGREGVTADELNLLMGSDLTREFVGKKTGQDVRGDPVLAQILKITGQKDADTLEAEARRIKSEIDLKVQLDEEQFSKAMAAALKKLDLKELLGEIFQKQFEAKIRGIDREAAAGRLARAAGG